MNIINVNNGRENICKTSKSNIILDYLYKLDKDVFPAIKKYLKED